MDTTPFKLTDAFGTAPSRPPFKQAVSTGKNLTKSVTHAKVRIAAPVVVGRKGEYYQLYTGAVELE